MFKLHPNYKIEITAGDSAELDLRLFNKDSLPRWEPKHRPLNIPALMPFPGKFTGKHVYDSEGNMLEDSEGNPIDSEGNYIYPIYPETFDSEGRPLLPWYWVLGRGPQFDWKKCPRIPSGFHQLQEEPIWGEIRLVVTDLVGTKVVLDKCNDEFPNTIFFDKEDTIDIPKGLYVYKLIYTTEKDTDNEEVQTIIDDAWFEVY